MIMQCALMAAVLYIPGWHRCGRGEDEALQSVRAAFANETVAVRNWDGNGRWKKAKANADEEAKRLYAELAALPDDERKRLTLVGHSLGARIAVRALARLGDDGKKVRRAVVMAAAIPRDDADVSTFATACTDGALIVCNPKDTMLRWGYRPFGGEHAVALGLTGPSEPPQNSIVSFVAPTIPRETPLRAAWAKVGLFRSLAAHYAPFYLEQVKRRKERSNVERAT